MIAPALSGFLSGLSLILAIGAQNAFVLRQGLARAHVFAVCLTCALSDALLIVAGAAGFGWAADSAPWLETALLWGGALFLVGYGLTSLRAAFSPHALNAASTARMTLWGAVAACLAFTWLNPHVYLDTLALLGALAAAWPVPARWWFAAGAVAASFVFFFGLGYGARLLAPLFARPAAWRALDFGVGLLMLALAALLLLK